VTKAEEEVASLFTKEKQLMESSPLSMFSMFKKHPNHRYLETMIE